MTEQPKQFDAWGFAAILGIVLFVGVAVMLGVTSSLERQRDNFAAQAAEHRADIRKLKQEAIEHGAAEYDSTTGVWQWKRKETP